MYYPVAVLCLSCIQLGGLKEITIWLILNYVSNLTWLMNFIWIPLDVFSGKHGKVRSPTTEYCKRKSHVMFALLAQVVAIMTSIGTIKHIQPEWRPSWEGARGDEWILLPSLSLVKYGVCYTIYIAFINIAVPVIFGLIMLG